MAKITLNSALAEIREEPTNDYSHPFLTKATFIFADDKGAALSTSQPGFLQGIKVEDFDEIIATAIHMPVKMNYLGDKVGNHLGAYVIGHISDMQKAVAEDGTTNQLIATALLYKDEYPEEIEYLKTKHAEGEAPGVSYELDYSDSIFENGVQWLKKIITSAATFVRNPGYGKRTALLALASAKDDEEFYSTMKVLVAHAEESTEVPKPKEKGGKIVEEELEKAKAEALSFKAEAETKTSRISELEELLETSNKEKVALVEENTSLKNERVLEGRVRKLAEAGIKLEADAEKAAKKKTFYLSLSDEAFEEYYNDLVEAKKSATPTGGSAFASLRTSEIPKPEVLEPTTLDDVKGMFKFGN